MVHMDLNKLSATTLGAMIAQRKCSAVEIAQACLAQIGKRDADVQAWAHIDPRHVLAQARERDQAPPRSALHGIPVGVKDVIDTYDMPTEYGSEIYAGHQPKADAACVALVREAGAVIMGKTVTVELAAFHYARTRNPHNLAHTPAGSSSGSAAALADFMTPLALGTQTGGSTIRPAAFCGVVGYKPSFNLVNRAGVKPLAESQDTVGLMARSVPDVAAMFFILSGSVPPDFDRKDARPPRIGICSMAAWPQLEPAMARALEEGAARLARSGARVKQIALHQPFEQSLAAQRKINDYEAWRALTHERLHHADQLSSTLLARMREAQTCTFDEYLDAQNVISECRALLHELFAEHDVLLTPSTPGEAPEGLTNTGDSNYIRIWTTFHNPAVNLPLFRGERGLPMGLQVIGPFREDRRMLSDAEWIVRTLQS